LRITIYFYYGNGWIGIYLQVRKRWRENQCLTGSWRILRIAALKFIWPIAIHVIMVQDQTRKAPVSGMGPLKHIEMHIAGRLITGDMWTVANYAIPGPLYR
jgi:hypothetical protein